MVNARDELIVADAYNYRIHGLTRDGAARSEWGRTWPGASGIAPLEVPSGLAIDSNGYVHIADSAHKRAVLLDSTGRFLAEWKLTEDAHPEMSSPTRVATVGDRAYFVDTSNNRIVVLEIRR